MSIAHVNAVLELQLPPAQKHVLTVLAHRLNDKTGRCNPSQERLLKDTGLSKSGLKLQLQKLRKAKLISCKYHNRFATDYSLNLTDLEGHEVALLDDLGGHEVAPLDGLEGHEVAPRGSRHGPQRATSWPHNRKEQNRTTTTTAEPSPQHRFRLPKEWTEQEQKTAIRQLSGLEEERAQEIINLAEMSRIQGKIRNGITPFLIGLVKADKQGTLDTSQLPKSKTKATSKEPAYSMPPTIAQRILEQMDQISAGDPVRISGYGLAMAEDLEKAREVIYSIKKTTV